MKNTGTVVFIESGMDAISMIQPLIDIKEIHDIIIIQLEEDIRKESQLYTSQYDKVSMGTYPDCLRADIVIMAFHLIPPLYQTKLELAQTNAKSVKEIASAVVNSGFQGIFVVASQPVDFMTYVVKKASQFPAHQVIGIGNVFYSQLLQKRLSQLLEVSPLEIQAYFLGEQGRSSIISWSNTYVGYMGIHDYLDSHAISQCQLENIDQEMKEKTYQVIENNHMIYDEIALSIYQIVKAIMNDEKIILCVSCRQEDDIYFSMPAIIDHHGIKENLKMELDDREEIKLHKIHDQLSQVIHTLINPIL